ncbi:MAG: alpha/beta fold hydrolase [Anaerolineae bacterium]
MTNKKSSLLVRILLALLGLLGIAALAFLLWASTPARPMTEVFERVPGLNEVGANERWLTFQPDGGAPTVGLILYPGGRVDFCAYAPTAQAIADQGYLVVLVRMPFNLAVFAPDAAAGVMAAYPQIEHWAVGGHSLGGAMAAHFAAAHPGSVQGLVLWAAYPAASDDLSRSDLRVVSISASLDGLATPEKIAASRPLLPPETVWVVVQGGNHAQFGWYGDQNGDNPSAISRETQQTQVIAATVALLESLK